MKIIVFTFFLIVTSIAQLCALPAADTAPAAAANATSKATDAASKAKNLLQTPNVTDVMSKLTKDGQGPVNPADILKKGTDFMSTVISACENFIKSVLKLCSPSSSVPGLDGLSKLTSIFKPTEVADMGKNVVDNIMKAFKLSPSSLAGVDELSKAKDGLPANGTDTLKKSPKDAAKKAADAAKDKDVISTVVGDALNIFGI